MLSMGKLSDRLDEICTDLGIPLGRGKNTALQGLLNVSSGRMSQIYADKEGARLGADAIGRLVEKGYCPEWVQDGKLPKKLKDHKDPETEYLPHPETATAAEIMAALESMLRLARVPLEVVAGPDRAALEARLNAALCATEQKSETPFISSMEDAYNYAPHTRPSTDKTA